MTLRAIILGLLVGLAISAYAYFNDAVAAQTMLIGSFLPISVFGGALVIVMLVNPALGVLGPRWPLRPGEVAVLIAIALAACSIPGANFCRYLVTVTAMPAQLAHTRNAWQAQQVMSYLPGGSSELAVGQVRDWRALAVRVMAARDEPAPSPVGQLWHRASPVERQRWTAAAESTRLTPQQVNALSQAVNRALGDPAFGVDEAKAPALTEATTQAATSPGQIIAANRRALDHALPDLLVPPPPGRHALVTGGRADAQVIGPLILGRDTQSVLPVGNVPWRRWLPTIALWLGVILCLSAAVLCMSLIVHPQWSQRELLQYPIAKFVELISARDAGTVLPNVARSRLFWLALAAVLAVHLLNGLHAWFPMVPQVYLQFDFTPLNDYFPNASRVPQAYTLFRPRIFIAMVAFAFMLNQSVSFTMGVSHVLYLMFGAMMLSYGAPVEYDRFSPNKMNLIRLGAFLGAAMIMLYTGRRYYANVALSALGGRRHSDTPHWSVAAARCIPPLLVIAIGLLMSAGMSVLMACVLVTLCLLIWLVLARMVAETGMVLISGPFLPLGVLPALVGYAALGPTQIIMLGVAGVLLLVDPREALMPYLVNGLQMGGQTGTRPQRLAIILLVMVVVGGIVAVVVTLTLQYEHGVNHRDTYATLTVPAAPFNEAARAASRLTAAGDLSASVAMNDWQRLAAIEPQPAALSWLGIGLAAILALGITRLRWAWWPLHPVVFLVWGTWAMGQLSVSFFLGWALKAAVVACTGSRGYRMALPFMVGAIAGELTGGLFWMIVGAAYQLRTGLAPVQYSILP
ncbi:MAG: DUF6785 family protein [Phycisphaeraceae bacterium]